MKKALVVVAACVLLLGMVQGVQAYTCTGTVFDDVNASMNGGTAFCGYIEHFSYLGITAGCQVSPPLYCPDSDVTRGQMAVLITKALDSIRNPMQIALLRWYEAIQNGTTFPVGTWPFGIAFDGANIWVANNSNNSVSKL
jgi:hypothetical protein